MAQPSLSIALAGVRSPGSKNSSAQLNRNHPVRQGLKLQAGKRLALMAGRFVVPTSGQPLLQPWKRTISRMNSSLNQWLRDAHAMEAQTAAVLARQSARMQDHPELKARFDLHLRETHAQRQRLETHLERRPRLAGESAKAERRRRRLDGQ